MEVYVWTASRERTALRMVLPCPVRVALRPSLTLPLQAQEQDRVTIVVSINTFA